MTKLEYWKARCEATEYMHVYYSSEYHNKYVKYYAIHQSLVNTPEPEDECEHPWESVDKSEGYLKCSKCGKRL